MKSFTVRIDGKAYDCQVEEAPEAKAERGKVCAAGEGRVLRIEKVPGQKVTKGELIMVLEPLSCETEILAPCDGRLSLVCAEAQEVKKGDFLLSVSP